MLAGVEQPLVQRPDLVEHAAPDQHAVELAQLAGFPAQLLPHRGHLALREVNLLPDVAQHLLVLRLLLDCDLATREVDGLEVALAGERADDVAAGLVGALDELAEPARPDQHVVVEEHDVLGLDLGQADVPRLVRRQVAIVAQQPEAALRRLRSPASCATRRGERPST